MEYLCKTLARLISGISFISFGTKNNACLKHVMACPVFPMTRQYSAAAVARIQEVVFCKHIKIPFQHQIESYGTMSSECGGHWSIKNLFLLQKLVTTDEKWKGLAVKQHSASILLCVMNYLLTHSSISQLTSFRADPIFAASSLNEELLSPAISAIQWNRWVSGLLGSLCLSTILVKRSMMPCWSGSEREQYGLTSSFRCFGSGFSRELMLQEEWGVDAMATLWMSCLTIICPKTT